MGCCTSLVGVNSSDSVSRSRRRPSTGSKANEGSTKFEPEAVEDERGLIATLGSKNIIEILKELQVDGRRKIILSSDNDQGKVSFADKKTDRYGDEFDHTLALGYTCRKGLKPESPNQDSWFVMEVDGDFSMYAVFDGHGNTGHDVSHFAKENLPKLIIQDPEFKIGGMQGVLERAFLKTQSMMVAADRMDQLGASMSGTTATLVVHDQTNRRLFTAHVADSTAVLGKRPAADRGSVVADALTVDHRPNIKEERQRIEGSGGRVIYDGYASHRVYAKHAQYPGLNMSRCLGDVMAQQACGIIAEPTVSVVDISSDDTVLLLCSDGVWEFITHLEAIELVCSFPPAQAQVAAERLAREAWDRWILEEGGAVVDDITVVLVYLNADPHLKAS